MQRRKHHAKTGDLVVLVAMLCAAYAVVVWSVVTDGAWILSVMERI